MGRVNNTWAYDQKHVRKYGKLYGSIDFEVNENVSEKLFEKQPNKPVIGKLMIGELALPSALNLNLTDVSPWKS